MYQGGGYRKPPDNIKHYPSALPRYRGTFGYLASFPRKGDACVATLKL